MNDSNTPDVDQPKHRIPLGITSLAQNEREQFGQKVRLAMGCMESTSEPVKGKAMPLDEASIRQRLKALSQEIISHHADLLVLLVRFDYLRGWKPSGTSHCAAWMNLEIGSSIQSAWEYLRVGRKLRLLPTLRVLFRAGKLTLSKVRLITRVADEDNEKILCHAALDASVSDIQRLCQGYRWNDDDNSEGENDQALQQWNSRSLTWNEANNGSAHIHLILPPEIAQAYLNSIEHSLNRLEDDTDSQISQRRADAALLMTEPVNRVQAGRSPPLIDQRLNEQFMQQRRSHEISMFSFENKLRDDKASFRKVRTLSPTNYRLRVVDAQGQDIHDHSNAGFNESKTQSNYQSNDYTRVYFAKPIPDYYYSANSDRYVPLFTHDVARCVINDGCV
jgi:hypothetical protein